VLNQYSNDKTRLVPSERNKRHIDHSNIEIDKLFQRAEKENKKKQKKVGEKAKAKWGKNFINVVNFNYQSQYAIFFLFMFNKIKMSFREENRLRSWEISRLISEALWTAQQRRQQRNVCTKQWTNARPRQTREHLQSYYIKSNTQQQQQQQSHEVPANQHSAFHTPLAAVGNVNVPVIFFPMLSRCKIASWHHDS